MQILYNKLLCFNWEWIGQSYTDTYLKTCVQTSYKIDLVFYLIYDLFTRTENSFIKNKPIEYF